jgi:hypothetical protein
VRSIPDQYDPLPRADDRLEPRAGKVVVLLNVGNKLEQLLDGLAHLGETVSEVPHACLLAPARAVLAAGLLDRAGDLPVVTGERAGVDPFLVGAVPEGDAFGEEPVDLFGVGGADEGAVAG